MTWNIVCVKIYQNKEAEFITERQNVATATMRMVF